MVSEPALVEKPQSVIQSVNVELASEALGSVKVRIFGTESALRVQVRSPEWEVRESLQSGLEGLVSRVEKLGVRVEEVARFDSTGRESTGPPINPQPAPEVFATETALQAKQADELDPRHGERGSGPDWDEAIRRHRQFRRRK
jgi:hypothetical protein